MAKKYSFSISDMFQNQAVDPSKLSLEISEGISTNLECINTADGICDLWFEEEIPSDSTSILVDIISSHDGVKFDCIDSAYLTSEGTTLTSSTNYIRRDRITLENMAAGDYEIKWYFEYSYSDNSSKPQFKIKVDNTVLAEFGRTPYVADTEWLSKSGFAFVNLKVGDHNIDIEYASGSSSHTVRLRRVRIGVKSIEGVRTRTIREIGEISIVDIIV